MASLVNRLGCCALALASVISAASAQQHHSYVADANREYAAIFSHPDNPCATQEMTSSYADCIGKEVTFTELHLATFLTAIRAIASQDTVEEVGGISELALVNKTNATWRQYRNSICDLTASGMTGGSGEGNAGTECMYKMDRSYAKQLADATFLHILAE